MELRPGLRLLIFLWAGKVLLHERQELFVGIHIHTGVPDLQPCMQTQEAKRAHQESAKQGKGGQQTMLKLIKAHGQIHALVTSKSNNPNYEYFQSGALDRMLVHTHF